MAKKQSHSPIRDLPPVRMAFNSVFDMHKNTSKLQAGKVYVIVGFGYSLLKNGVRRQFWDIAELNKRRTTVQIFKDDINRFEDKKMLTYKGMVK
jgi:hypothetical protein